MYVPGTGCVDPTDAEIRYAKLFTQCDRLLGTFFEGQHDSLTMEDVIEELVVRLIVELASNEESVVTPDALSEILDRVGNAAHGHVD